MAHDHSKIQTGKNLKIAFFLNLCFTIFEIIGGLYVNSIAIISDAVHDLGDSLSLGLAWYLQNKSRQKSNSRFSFGYKRFSLLGALINSVILIAGSIYVIYHAVKRLKEPELSDADGMIIFAIVGVLVNGFAAWKLSGAKSMNERVVSWHLLEDVLGWLAILLVAIILKFKQTPYLDPALSLFITAFILWNVVKRLRSTFHIFLQGVPEGISVNELESELMKIKHVSALHHTHIWSLEGENHVFSTHIKLDNIDNLKELVSVKKKVKAQLSDYHFDHCTVQIELNKESCSIEEKTSD